MSKLDYDGDGVMPFGKWEGYTIEDMVAEDLSYARWLLEQDWLNDDLADDINIEIEALEERQEEELDGKLGVEVSRITKE
jgi:hypothetical protein